METMHSFSVGVLCAMIWILFYWLVGLQVKQVSNTHQFITKRLQIDMIMNVVGEDLFQACKQFVHSGVKGLAWLYSFKRHEQFFRLALTLKRDAPHSCLINLSWRQECTTTTHNSGRGVPFGVTKSCGRSKPQKLPPKADNTFAGHCPQKCLFVGEDLFCKQFARSGIEGPARLCSFKRHEQFLRLAPTSKKDASHSCLISLSWRQEGTTTTPQSKSRQTACRLGTNPPPQM